MTDPISIIRTAIKSNRFSDDEAARAAVAGLEKAGYPVVERAAIERAIRAQCADRLMAIIEERRAAKRYSGNDYIASCAAIVRNGKISSVDPVDGHE